MGGDEKSENSPLTGEDAQLWNEVRRSVSPQHLRGKPHSEGDQAAGAIPQRRSSPAQNLGPGSRILPAPIEGLERRLSRRIGSGRAEIHSTIDLHGMTSKQAYVALVAHILAAKGRGDKRVLVITGKGSRQDYDPESLQQPGVLRRLLPDWVRGEDLAPYVVAFEPARQQHGGSGAFYLQLRSRT